MLVEGLAGEVAEWVAFENVCRYFLCPPHSHEPSDSPDTDGPPYSPDPPDSTDPHDLHNPPDSPE